MARRNWTEDDFVSVQNYWNWCVSILRFMQKYNVINLVKNAFINAFSFTFAV